MKHFVLLALASLGLTTACAKDETTAPTTLQVSGTLAAANELPAVKVPSTGTGTFTGTYMPSTMVLNYTLTFSGLTGPAIGAHLHFGDAKHTNGAIWLPFANVPAATSGTVTGTSTLTKSQSDSITTGHVYANVHTDNNKGGEIRATVVVK